MVRPSVVFLGGLSMGGHVAMEIMRNAPERIQRLALIDTRAGIDSPDRLKVRSQDKSLIEDQGFEALAAKFPDRWMHPSNAARTEMRDLVLQMVKSVSEEVREAQVRALLTRIDSRPFLPNIKCPTLILCGRQDIPNPVSMHEEMAGLIAGSWLQVIEDCGHLSPIEQPEVVTNALRDWMNRPEQPMAIG